jgi:hypothetical protein
LGAIEVHFRLQRNQSWLSFTAQALGLPGIPKATWLQIVAKSATFEQDPVAGILPGRELS